MEFNSQFKAMQTLNRLMVAAKQAQSRGKHIALSKLIDTASKISGKLEHSLERENVTYHFEPVAGVIIE